MTPTLLDRQEDRERLPDLVVEPGPPDLLDQDGVGPSELDEAAPSVTSPITRIARPGPGNGWRPTASSGSPELAPDLAHLVLEQLAQAPSTTCAGHCNWWNCAPHWKRPMR